MSEPRERRWVPLALVVGVTAIAFAGPFFRKAAPTHPFVAAGLRLAMASALLLPFTLRARAAGRFDRRLAGAAVLGGLAYAVHFGSWVASLYLTTVAASVTLVTATPLLLAVVALVTGRDRPSRALWLALLFAGVGVSLIGGYDLGSDTDALLGDLLAVVGAAAMAAWLLLGRRLGEFDVLAFSGMATGVAALLLLTTAAVMGLPLGAATPEAWLFLALAALIPQLVGHNLLTWALRHTTPTVVGMATVLEPVGATALAFLWLHESVSPQVLVGCGFTIAAVMLALRARDG